MNKRIPELSDKSGLSSNLYDEEAFECRDKFAEMIVRECEKSIKSVPTHFEAQDKIIVECLKAIRETFRS